MKSMLVLIIISAPSRKSYAMLQSKSLLSSKVPTKISRIFYIKSQRKFLTTKEFSVPFRLCTTVSIKRKDLNANWKETEKSI